MHTFIRSYLYVVYCMGDTSVVSKQRDAGEIERARPGPCRPVLEKEYEPSTSRGEKAWNARGTSTTRPRCLVSRHPSDRARVTIDRSIGAIGAIDGLDRSMVSIDGLDRSVWMRQWCARDARACGGDDDRARVIDESRVRGRGDDGAGGDADGDVFDRARGERTETRGDWIRRWDG